MSPDERVNALIEKCSAGPCNCASVDIGVGELHEPMCKWPRPEDYADAIRAAVADAERERDELAAAALAGIAGLGVETAREGYVGAPHLLRADLARVKERVTELERGRDVNAGLALTGMEKIDGLKRERDGARRELALARAEGVGLREAMLRLDVNAEGDLPEWAAREAWRALSTSPQAALAAEVLAKAEAMERDFAHETEGLEEPDDVASPSVVGVLKAARALRDWRPGEEATP